MKFHTFIFKNKIMFIHHVFFWLENPKSEKDQRDLVNGLHKLRTVPGLIQSHIGVPAPANREVIDSSYNISWLTVFATQEEEAVYQQHPVHLEFIENCKHLWKRVLVYDSLNA
jgi:hypothetical protein